jgi:hypothetical protein
MTLAACVAIAAAALALRDQRAPRLPHGASALAAIPNGASFVLTLELARLRDSELGSALLSAGRELPGVGPLDAICGFDPSDQVRQIAVAVPRSSTGGELGIAIAGEVEAERIASCVEQVVRRRGGIPARTQLGSFVAIRDRTAAGAEVVVRDRGPVLLGEGHYLRDMIDAVEGRAENLGRDPVHAALRRRLGEDAPVVASWLLEEGWLERASGDELAPRSSLSELRAAALRVDVAPEVVVRGLLICSSPEACREIAGVLRDFSRDLGPALRDKLGDDPLADARIEQTAASIEISLHVPGDRLSGMARQLLSQWAARP